MSLRLAYGTESDLSQTKGEKNPNKRPPSQDLCGKCLRSLKSPAGQRWESILGGCDTIPVSQPNPGPTRSWGVGGTGQRLYLKAVAQTPGWIQVAVADQSEAGRQPLDVSHVFSL